MRPPREAIPVIDLFAGPGGLAEGFWETGKYEVRLSIEKDPEARETLKLRSFLHSFRPASIPHEYYELLAGHCDLEDLYRAYPAAAATANETACLAELGGPSFPDEAIDKLVRNALGDIQGRQWVLIGGPPCQAYSLVGRARRHGDPSFYDDPRHTLYKQFLRIVRKFKPGAFVLENVPGILTARLGPKSVFSEIQEGLTRNGAYRLYSLTCDDSRRSPLEPKDFLLRAEDYGIPQRRHRIVMVGVRADIPGRPELLQKCVGTTVRDAISDLPPIRSHLSKEKDGLHEWRSAVRAMMSAPWFPFVEESLRTRLEENLERLAQQQATEPAADPPRPSTLETELSRPLRGSVPNHSARSHMRADLWRYFYAATYTEVYGVSPQITDFPQGLWPDHANLQQPRNEFIFADRFHVQAFDRPASTIAAHIAKDGHYYIHPDPVQCRSLTVREAARLQTFPDDYLFLGTATAQFSQVGNAVPPLLAKQVANALCPIFDIASGKAGD